MLTGAEIAGATAALGPARPVSRGRHPLAPAYPPLSRTDARTKGDPVSRPPTSRRRARARRRGAAVVALLRRRADEPRRAAAGAA